MCGGVGLLTPRPVNMMVVTIMTIKLGEGNLCKLMEVYIHHLS